MIKEIAKRVREAAKTAVSGRAVEAEVNKRNSLFVSRPIINAQEWFDWATKWGVPNIVPVAEMHVTVVYSLTNVQMIPDRTVYSVYIGPGYCQAGAFCMFGPAGNVLVMAFDDWSLQDRHWAFRYNGAVVTWPTFRPHMTISTDATGFELSDEALADAPINIHLGGEVFADGKLDEVAEQEDDGDDDTADEGDDVLVVIIEIAASAAAKTLEEKAADLSVNDRVALRDIERKHSITKAVAKRLAKADWAPEAIKALAGSTAAPAEKKLVEKTITMTMGPLPESITKNSTLAERCKADDELQIAYGWASVSTVKGVLVNDLQGDTITVKAQRQFLHDLIRGQRGGTFDHEGPHCNELVEGIVLDHGLQKSLGIDLGMEGLLIGMHVPDPNNWAMVKSGSWMFSIAGTVIVEEGT